jgi:diaphanous 1
MVSSCFLESSDLFRPKMLGYTGLIESNSPVAPLVNHTPPTPSAQRHFSSFPLTSHLHTPVLRLVSLNVLLTINLTFLRVPEIHDGYEYKFFISQTMTVNEVIERVTEELGLTKSLPIPGGGVLEYVVEEVWCDRNSESTV